MSARDGLRALAAPLAGLAAFAALVALLDPRLLSRTAPMSREDENAIRQALASYNRIYQDFFASGGEPALIDDFPASRDIKHHVFRDIGFLRSAGYVQVHDLAEAVVREVRRTGPGEAEALVFEEWNHVLQFSETRQPASPLKGLGQGFRYVLRRSAGRWVVVAWDLADLEPPPEKGFTW